MRKANLQRLLARRLDGIFLRDFEQGEIGPDLFRAACGMGLEGLVSKRRDRPYQARQVEALGEDQEPEASGDEPGDGGVRVVAELWDGTFGCDARAVPTVSYVHFFARPLRNEAYAVNLS